MSQPFESDVRDLAERLFVAFIEGETNERHLPPDGLEKTVETELYCTDDKSVECKAQEAIRCADIFFAEWGLRST